MNLNYKTDIITGEDQFPLDIRRLIKNVQEYYGYIENESNQINYVWHSNIIKLNNSLDSPSPNQTIEESRKFASKVWGISYDNYHPTIHLSYASFDKNRLKICRNIRFLDSSIWHYFVQISEDNPESSIESLKTTFKQILSNYQKGYYNLTISWEYKELQERLLAQSYIRKYGEQEGHAVLSPFLFHAETENKERLDNGSKLLKYNWRFLLIDDCVNCHYTTNIQKEEPHNEQKEIQGRALSMQGGAGDRTVYKESIISERLKEFYAQLKIEDRRREENPISVDLALNIDHAIKKMESNKYDLILLDYKLAEKEYGYDLLDRISKSIQLQKIAGPNGQFYFMFISAYTTAVQERLSCEDISIDTDYWFIGRGACPTNTPYLFLYCMKRMMKLRYDKLTKHSKQLLKDLNKQKNTISDQDIETEKGEYATMTMFLTKLYERDNERNNCVLGFNAFLNLRRVYDTIKHDVNHDKNHKEEERRMKSSPLIMSLFKDEEFCSNSFWEHLQNLVYLTAFGTIRQWPEMWEDYTFIKTKLEKAEKVMLPADEQKDERPSILIRNYILSLKGMMS